MDASIDGTTHILCLVSTRYRALWARDPAVPGGYGVAFESIRLIHHLYLLKQHNDGRILTLRPDGHGYDCIPRDLALDCPEYCWRAHLDDLLSHLGEAELPGQVGVLAPAPPPSPAPRNPAQPATPPAAQPRLTWASASGKDDCGHWADLTVNGVTQRMRWIAPTGPAGFDMGDENFGRSREIVAAGFWLADTPCTQAFWQAVTGQNPSRFKHGPDAPQRPVESVSWDDVMEQFIPRLMARQAWGVGEGPCLPTEMEWEYAARAGMTTAYWWGNAWDATRGNANENGARKSDDKEGTIQVKRYRPNSWGLYDVHGNVWEWCADVWRKRRDAPEARPDADLRVVRGGSWFDYPGYARAASRRWWLRWYADRRRGFRFALRSPGGPDRPQSSEQLVTRTANPSPRHDGAVAQKATNGPRGGRSSTNLAPTERPGATVALKWPR
jgi:formylglycine-generating enzyme required for sulfatase activity